MSTVPESLVVALLEVAEDMRGYTHDWDWKYGEYWDKVLTEASKAIEPAPEPEDVT